MIPIKKIFTTLIIVSIATVVVHAQGDGPRFYWKSMAGLNAVPVFYSSLSGNSNPFDPSNTVLAGSNFSSSMAIAGYAKMLPLFKRAAMVSIIEPMGRISSDVNIAGQSFNETARGFGDPMLQLSVNLIGPKAITNMPDMLRYKPGFSLDVIGSVAFPVGEYDNESPVNLGQNRWYGRVGFPIVWQLGSWVPGKRTTLELLPAAWLFGDNKDFVGKKLSTEAMFQVEGHLTRDFTEHFWVSLDAISYSGGDATIDTVQTSGKTKAGLGGTFGYKINENMQMNVAYYSSINDQDDDDLKMDAFRVTFIYGWHKLIEGMHRINKNE